MQCHVTKRVPFPNIVRTLMKSGILCAATLLAAPLFSVASLANDPDGKPADEAKAEQTEPEAEAGSGKEPIAVDTPEVKVEEKRICRRIRIDASSRRATRVCKTKEEWRLFNQRR